MSDAAFTLADLCDLAGVTPRTVRYYVTEGLLRSPGTTGPGARYDEGHLARLRLTRRLQREHLPLAEIRRRLAALDDDEAISLAGGRAEPPGDSALDYVRGVLAGKGVGGAGRPVVPASPSPASPPPGSPSPGSPSQALLLERRLLVDPSGPELWSADAPRSRLLERSHWERIALSADVEIHVRRPLTRDQNRAVARLLEEARRLLEENQP